MATHELKALQGQKQRIIEEKNVIKTQQQELKAKFDSLSSRERNIDDQIKALSAKELVISEHALLRFIERAMGFDLEAIKKTMLPDETKKLLETMGDGAWPLPSGFKAKVKDRTIVTIVE